MKKLLPLIFIFNLSNLVYSQSQEKNSDYPQTKIANNHVTMKLYLPDPDSGYYRATRFDWSGIIYSLRYKGHEYFGEWKKSHDPLVFEDITGPAESYISPGLGYQQAKPGEGFIRIGIGVLEKPEEKGYTWNKTYSFIDQGKWTVNKGDDWIEFVHELDYEGYGYVYSKKIELKKNEPGFKIIHQLKNTGSKIIETDQYNHNFFVIDGLKPGPSFSIKYPFAISTTDNLKGLMKMDNQTLFFKKSFIDTSLYFEIQGYSNEITDHEITVLNHKTNASISFKCSKPIYKMSFWACETTLCPENFVYISVLPGKKENWISDYTVFLN